MRYEGIVYRPPSEAESLIIQATIGCPHNKCNFCNMYTGKAFRIRPIQETFEDLEMAKDYYGNGVKTVFFADGNTILMKTKDLVKIFNYTKELFPKIERITLYGSARFLILKKPEELKELNAAGLTRLHSGMESGDDDVLKLINKGAAAQDVVKAGIMVKEAGIQLSEYIMVGVGGRGLWRQHAINTAKALNQIKPDFIRLRTFMPFPGTVMYDLMERGEFELMTPHEALEETKLLVANLEGINSMFLSDHFSNYWNINGKLPSDKFKMLDEIDRALKVDESQFRNPLEGQL